MKTRQLAEISKGSNVAGHAQDELAEIAREIDAGLKDATYEPTNAELAGIDRGLRDAEQGRFATDAEVEAAFIEFRSR